MSSPQTDPLTPSQKLSLITANLHETLRPDILTQTLSLRPLRIYWGTATTGRPHAAYLLPALKIAQFLRAGCHVTILLADLHALLDAEKAPEGVLEWRAGYYERVIRALLRSVGVPLDQLKFVRGSEYQLSAGYTRDLLRLSKKASVHDAVKASSEIVKSGGEACMADGVYPLMQVLDEEYLDVDVQFGGLDQRKTFVLAGEVMPKMEWKVRAHLMSAMVPGLAGGKMSSSEAKSKIDLLDEPAVICKKVAKAFCPPCVVEGNGVLAFIQHVLMPSAQLREGTGGLRATLKGESEERVFKTFEELREAYERDFLTPQLAKKIVEEGLVELTSSIRGEFEADAEWQ